MSLLPSFSTSCSLASQPDLFVNTEWPTPIPVLAVAGHRAAGSCHYAGHPWLHTRVTNPRAIGYRFAFAAALDNPPTRSCSRSTCNRALPLPPCDGHPFYEDPPLWRGPARAWWYGRCHRPPLCITPLMPPMPSGRRMASEHMGRGCSMDGPACSWAVRSLCRGAAHPATPPWARPCCRSWHRWGCTSPTRCVRQALGEESQRLKKWQKRHFTTFSSLIFEKINKIMCVVSRSKITSFL